MTAKVRSLEGSMAVLETDADETVLVPDAARVGAQVGRPLDVTVRPEKIMLASERPAPGQCVIHGRVKEVVYLGTSTQYAITTRGGSELLVFVQNASDSRDVAEREDEVWLSWRPEHSLGLAVEPVDADRLDSTKDEEAVPA